MGEWDAPHLMPLDDEIMPYVDMCNIACGGHAGSEKIMSLTIESAIKEGVKIGAHPGFEDRNNFGRKYLSLKPKELSESLEKQITLFLSSCSKSNVVPHHIKAHGALYHACNQREREAEVLIAVIKMLDPRLILLVAPGSLLEERAESEQLRTMAESFIDRSYNDDFTLVSRSEAGAVILDVNRAKTQFDLLSEGKIISKTGKIMSLKSDSACIHGDNPKALQILKAIINDQVQN
jgi:UPF0271 protein